MFRSAAIALVVASLPACTPDQTVSVPAAANAGGFDVPQILSSSQLAKYRALAPKTAYPKLNAILADQSTFWYDHEAMPPSYQDSIAPDVTVGCRPNNEGANLIDIIPGGRQMFSEDAQTWSFPFAHTAGMDRAPNVQTVDFLYLPVVNGARQPVAYYVKNGDRDGIGLVQWRWIFPKGTVFGEMILIKDGSGNLYTSEVRIRERYLDGWAINSFRPFPTARSLADAIASKRPAWQADGALAALVAHLNGGGALTPKTVGSQVFPGVYENSGSIDTLPATGDDALTAELLTTATFASSYEQTWRSSGSQQAYAASTAASFHVVPTDNDAGLIKVNDTSCSRCHQDAQRGVNDFNSAAVLYGDVWGSDQIFSWHPFDTDLCHGAADDNRAVRPAFQSSGMVQPYSSSQHGSDLYHEIALH